MQLQQEYAHFHVQAVALPNVRRLGQYFTPYVCLQRQRKLPDGRALWDTVASTEPYPVLLSDPLLSFEKKRDLAAFLGWPVDGADSYIGDDLLEASPCFPRYVCDYLATYNTL